MSGIGAHHAISPLPIYDRTGETMSRAWEMIGRVGLQALSSTYRASVEAATVIAHKIRGTRYPVEDLESGAAWSDTEADTDSAIMDAILPQLLSFPPHPPPVTPLSDAEFDKQIKIVVQLLNQTPANKLTAGVIGGGDLLNILNPTINTLPFLYVLLAHINGPQSGKQAVGSQVKALSPDGALWAKMEAFMQLFDPIQIRYAGNLFPSLINVVAHSAIIASKPLLAIPPIRSAILRLDPSSSTFTSSHLIFARLCLDARAFHASLPVLDNDIFHFPPITQKAAANPTQKFLCSGHETSSTFITVHSGLTEKLDYRDHLQYFLFGAMLYMGSKKWERAQLFLELVLVSPAINTASMIQVEAYKKWILVNLLQKGHPSPMPRTVNGQTAKIYRSLTKAYENISEVFKDGITQETTADRLRVEVEAGRAIWQDDRNYGLVLQVIDAFRRFSILNLEQTYAALTIADVAQRTSDDPCDYEGTALYVTSMISACQLNATITKGGDTQNWVLRFATSSTAGPLARTEEQLNEEINKQLVRTAILSNHAKELDRKMGLSKEYIEWVKRAPKDKELSPNGDLDPGRYQAPDDFGPEDEDMMEDL